jgi:hypothetical protein
MVIGIDYHVFFPLTPTLSLGEREKFYRDFRNPVIA